MNFHNPKAKIQQNQNKRICKNEDIVIKKINLFEDKGNDNYYVGRESEKQMYRQKPIPRNRESNIIEVECDNCEEAFKINKAFLKQDPMTNKYTYTCDSCIFKKGRQR